MRFDRWNGQALDVHSARRAGGIEWDPLSIGRSGASCLRAGESDTFVYPSPAESKDAPLRTPRSSTAPGRRTTGLIQPRKGPPATKATGFTETEPRFKRNVPLCSRNAALHFMTFSDQGRDGALRRRC